ncbi:hypothetical protein V1511DRAFT_508261 [Dipodascopsis uninucleata]
MALVRRSTFKLVSDVGLGTLSFICRSGKLYTISHAIRGLHSSAPLGDSFDQGATQSMRAEGSFKIPNVISDADLVRLTENSGHWSIVEPDSFKTKRPFLERTVQFEEFDDAFLFLTKLAFYTHSVNHHPRIFSFHRNVSVRLGTFSKSKGGFISVDDCAMADKIDSIIDSMGSAKPKTTPGSDSGPSQIWGVSKSKSNTSTNSTSLESNSSSSNSRDGINLFREGFITLLDKLVEPPSFEVLRRLISKKRNATANKYEELSSTLRRERLRELQAISLIEQKRTKTFKRIGHKLQSDYSGSESYRSWGIDHARRVILGERFSVKARQG